MSGSFYILLAPTLTISQAFDGARCSGEKSLVGVPVVAVAGLPGQAPVCTSAGPAFSVSTSALSLANSTFALTAFSSSGCTGAAVGTFGSLGSDDCQAGGSGASALSLLTGLGAPPSASATGTPTRTPTATISPTQTGTRTPTLTPSTGASTSRTPSHSRTPSKTYTPTPSGARSRTVTPTQSATVTPPVTLGASGSETPSETPSNTPTPSGTPPRTRSRTPSRTPTPPPTQGAPPSASSTNSAYPSASMSNLPSGSDSPTPSSTNSAPGATPSPTPSPTASSSAIAPNSIIATVLNISMANTTSPDALLATMSLLLQWLALPATTAGSWAPYFDDTTTPPSPLGFSFTLLVPKDAAASLVNSYTAATADAGGSLRQRLLQSTASSQEVADSLTATVTAMSMDGSLAVAVAQSGLAASLGYDSTDSLVGALTVAPAAIAVAAPPTPSPSPSPARPGAGATPPPSPLEAGFLLTGLPDSLFAPNGTLLPSTLAALSSALAQAFSASTGCGSQCTTTIVRVLNVATGVVLFQAPGYAAARRQLQSLAPAGIAVAFTATGPPALLAALSAAAPPAAFVTSLTTALQGSGGGWVSVQASIPTPPSTGSGGGPASGPPIGAIAGGAGGGGVLLLAALAYYLWCVRGKGKAGGKAVIPAGVTIRKAGTEV